MDDGEVAQKDRWTMERRWGRRRCRRRRFFFNFLNFISRRRTAHGVRQRLAIVLRRASFFCFCRIVHRNFESSLIDSRSTQRPFGFSFFSSIFIRVFFFLWLTGFILYLVPIEFFLDFDWLYFYVNCGCSVWLFVELSRRPFLLDRSFFFDGFIFF